MYLCNYSKLICFECFIKYDIYNTKGNKIKFTIRDNSIFYTIDTCEYNYTYESHDNECIINDIHCYVLLRDNNNVLLLLPTLPIIRLQKKDTKKDTKIESTS